MSEESPLTAREAAFIQLAEDIAVVDLGANFDAHIEAALHAGATRGDTKEAVLHMTIYGAFPKVLEATAHLNALYARWDREGRYATAGFTYEKPGENFVRDPAVRDALLALDPDFGDLAVRMAGEVWGRPGLTQRERALESLAADVVNGTLEGPLQFHIDMALKGGAPTEALFAVIESARGRVPDVRIANATSATRAHLAERGDAASP